MGVGEHGDPFGGGAEGDAVAGEAGADAEADTLRLLSEIRAAIAGEVRTAAGLDAVRAALSRAFDAFIVRRRVPRVHVELILEPELVIEPVVRERPIEGYSENLRPMLRREALSQAEENQRVGLPRRA